MSFVDVQFPVDISYGAVGGAVFSTDVIESFGGYEQRNINWSQSRGAWNVAHGVKTEVQLNELIAFFRARRGRAIGFRFKDWSDYKATGQIIGTGNASTTVFQLVKSYTSGGVTVDRTIKKPVNNGSLKIYLNSVLQSSGFSVNYNTGVVTFTSAPGNGVVITADFEFDVPVRFDTDELQISLDNFNIGSWSSIPVVEVRL